MSAYLITYDLNKPGQNYNELYKAIKELGTWWHCLDSNWIVISTKTTSAIRDLLNAHIDSNDDLLVLKLEGGWASHGLSKDCTDWLKKNL